MIQKLILKFISVDSICSLIAKAIAKLLNTASQNGGEYWDKSKAILKKVALWINLFNEVYEDDELTATEEAKIAEAIKNETSVEKIVEIIKK